MSNPNINCPRSNCKTQLVRERLTRKSRDKKPVLENFVYCPNCGLVLDVDWIIKTGEKLSEK